MASRIQAPWTPLGQTVSYIHLSGDPKQDREFAEEKATEAIQTQAMQSISLSL